MSSVQGLGDDAQGGGEEEDGGSERGGDKGKCSRSGGIMSTSIW